MHGTSSRIAWAIAFGATGLTAPSTAAAHDYWMVPSEPIVRTARDDVTLSLLVGEDFVADEVKAYESKRVTRFDLIGASETIDLRASAIEGALPFGQLPLRRFGGALIALDRNASRIELPAEKFEAYLPRRRARSHRRRTCKAWRIGCHRA